MWMRLSWITSEPGLTLPWRTYFVVVKINKAVVGSSNGDMPKYAGQVMAFHRTPGILGVPLLQCSCLSMAILDNFGLGVLWAQCIILLANVTLLKGTVMSYVTSQYCMCIGHMTFYYKRAANTLVGGSCLLFVHSSGGWCLTHVGCDASSTSLGWSLLSLTVIIVLALVNSAMSPAGILKYLNETWECCSTPC